MGIIEVNQPSIPYSTLIKRNLNIFYIRDYVPLYSGIQLVFFRDYFRLKEDRECMNKRNIETRLTTDCCRGKALCIICSEYVCVSVVLSIQNAVSMRHNILLSDRPVLLYRILPHDLKKVTIFRKKLLDKVCSDCPFFYNLDAQILYFITFVTFLYLFRALLCSSSGGQLYYYSIWYRHCL